MLPQNGTSKGGCGSNCPTVTAGFTTGINGFNVTFADDSLYTNGATIIGTPQWSFGDGMTGTGNTTYHVYAKAGTYDVKEKVAATGNGNDFGSIANGSVVIVGPSVNQTGTNVTCYGYATAVCPTHTGVSLLHFSESQIIGLVLIFGFGLMLVAQAFPLTAGKPLASLGILLIGGFLGLLIGLL